MIPCENILNRMLEKIENVDLKIVELALQDVLVSGTIEKQTK